MLLNSRVYIIFTLFLVLFLTVYRLSSSSNCPKGILVDEINVVNTTKGLLAGIIDCEDLDLERKVTQRGKFVVFENYIPAKVQFKCGESVTLTAPGDYRFLDNVVPLVERWRGPISISLYAPGTDFFTTLQCIAYLRKCTTSLVQELVTFHLFFEFDHMPNKKGKSLIDIYVDTFDCSLQPPYALLKDSQMYKETHNLTYPINVARNIAKTTAQTHFVFPSDIELYPTRNFIPKFLNFAREHPDYVQKDSKNVFVLPIFEVLSNQNVPENKTHLREMFKNKKAILFHQNVCSPCHKIPSQDAWLSAEESQELEVFDVTKRQGSHAVWEPFFVCTQREPLWDERLNWEGQGNKMCQAYALCIHDYDFMVLDNAFLIHKPGVKKKKVQVLKHKNEIRSNNKLLIKIRNEMQNIFGQNKKCKT